MTIFCKRKFLNYLFFNFHFIHYLWKNPVRNTAWVLIHKNPQTHMPTGYLSDVYELFSNSPSWARTNNPTVNSRVLCHWAIEECFLKVPSRTLKTSYRIPSFQYSPSPGFRPSLRPVSGGPLHALPRFHSRPIHLVFSQGSYPFLGEASSRGGLRA